MRLRSPAPALALLTLLALTGGCSAPTPAANAAATAAPTGSGVAAPSASPSSSDPEDGEAMCKVAGDDGRGVYYVSLTSRTEHDYSACAGGQRIATSLDDLFAMPGNVDRRCFLSAETYHAIAAVYSSSSADDRAAARDRCTEPGASENG